MEKSIKIGDKIITNKDEEYTVDEIIYIKKLKDGVIVDSEQILYYGCNKVGKYEDENSFVITIHPEDIKRKL